MPDPVEREPMRVVSLFSGLEGIGLGLELAGPFRVVAQAEIDPWCSAILARSYPDTVKLGDVREVGPGDFPPYELLAAGFPCQPVSDAGKGLAEEDERWLWPEVERVIGMTRPPFVLLENVRGLLKRGMPPVIGGLRDLGYSAQWDLWPAAAVGAPHLRHRVWIIAWREDQNLGAVFFGRRPTVSPYWCEYPEPLPRLLPKVPHRKHRLTALGNAVVPQAVEAVARAFIAALDTEPLTAPSILGHDIDTITRWRPAGALLDGVVHFHTSSVGRIRRRLWPTPAGRDAAWSLEALMACVDKAGEPARDPHARFYHPTTGQIVQRGLLAYVEGAEEGLWPTPAASDGLGGRNERGALLRAGDAGARTLQRPSGTKASLSLSTAVDAAERPDDFLPTPLAADARGPQVSRGRREQKGEPLYERVRREAEADLLPTPMAGNGRKSERALTSSGAGEGHGRRSGGGQSSPLGLEQVAELSEGIVPADLPHVDDLPMAARAQIDAAWPEGVERPACLIPTPVGFVPTPTASDGALSGSRNTPGSRANAGVSLTDYARGDGGTGRDDEDGRLFLTPTAAPYTGGGRGGPLQEQVAERGEENELLPTPAARDHKGPNPNVREGGDDLPSRVEKIWPTPKAHPSGPDFARHGRDESGSDDLATAAARDAPRREASGLNPAWVGWLMGYPPGWDDLPDELVPAECRGRGKKAEVAAVEAAACGCPVEFVDADGFCACCHAHVDDPDGLYAVQRADRHGLPGCPLVGSEVAA